MEQPGALLSLFELRGIPPSYVGAVRKSHYDFPLFLTLVDSGDFDHCVMPEGFVLADLSGRRRAGPGCPGGCQRLVRVWANIRHLAGYYGVRLIDAAPQFLNHRTGSGKRRPRFGRHHWIVSQRLNRQMISEYQALREEDPLLSGGELLIRSLSQRDFLAGESSQR